MSSNKPKSTRPFQEGSQEGRTELANSFIIATGPEDIKPDVVSRKLIRHHVMKGRNRKRLAPERHHLGSWNANQRRSYTYVVAPIPAQPSISLNSLAYPFALFPGSENGILQCIYDCAYHLLRIRSVQLLTHTTSSYPINDNANVPLSSLCGCRKGK